MDALVSPQSVAVERLRKRVLTTTLTDRRIVGPAIIDAFKKLDPRVMWRNPVMFAVEMVAALTTVLFVRDLIIGAEGLGFSFQIILWLWFTVLFANFAEAVAEGRGKAQAATLRRTKTQGLGGGGGVGVMAMVCLDCLACPAPLGWAAQLRCAHPL